MKNFGKHALQLFVYGIIYLRA